MTEEINLINFIKEDGTLKTKEDFLKEMEDFYETVSNSLEDSEEPTTLETCICPNTQVDIDNTFKTFDFIHKTIYITDLVTQDIALYVIESIRFWNQVDAESEEGNENSSPIQIFINTDGGELNATMSIISAIKLSKTPVYTYNIGKAYSAGFFILVSGHKRFGIPYASYLFHEGSIGHEGDAHKAIEYMDFYKAQLKVLRNIVLERTKISENSYEEHKKDDWWFSTEDALKNGIIDETMTSFIMED